jgi:maltose/moltooligosaccharide transporter
MPYAILSGSLPADKMGVYMGLFNGTITIPQITAGLIGAVLLTQFDNNAMMVLVIAGVSMAVAGIIAYTLKDNPQKSSN